MFLLHVSLFPTAKINIFCWPLLGEEKCTFEIHSGTHILLLNTYMVSMNTMSLMRMK